MGVPTFASVSWTSRPIRQFAAELVLCAIGFVALTLVLAAVYDGAGACVRGTRTLGSKPSTGGWQDSHFATIRELKQAGRRRSSPGPSSRRSRARKRATGQGSRSRDFARPSGRPCRPQVERPGAVRQSRPASRVPSVHQRRPESRVRAEPDAANAWGRGSSQRELATMFA